jgi:hypothetical protein
MEITGECHCGSVRYSAAIDPERVSICHCTDCQTLTGSPYRVTVAARRDDLRRTCGDAKAYVKTAESGRQRRHFFCSDCGTPLFATGVDDDSLWGIRWGSIDQRLDLAPRRQIWCRSALPWIGGIADLPGRETD